MGKLTQLQPNLRLRRNLNGVFRKYRMVKVLKRTGLLKLFSCCFCNLGHGLNTYGTPFLFY